MFVVNTTGRTVTLYGINFLAGQSAFFRQYAFAASKKELRKLFAEGGLVAFKNKSNAHRYNALVLSLRNVQGDRNLGRAAAVLKGLRNFDYTPVIDEVKSGKINSIDTIKWVAAIMLSCDLQIVDTHRNEYIKAAKMVHAVKNLKLEVYGKDAVDDMTPAVEALVPGAKGEAKEVGDVSESKEKKEEELVQDGADSESGLGTVQEDGVIDEVEVGSDPEPQGEDGNVVTDFDSDGKEPESVEGHDDSGDGGTAPDTGPTDAEGGGIGDTSDGPDEHAGDEVHLAGTEDDGDSETDSEDTNSVSTEPVELVDEDPAGLDDPEEEVKETPAEDISDEDPAGLGDDVVEDSTEDDEDIEDMTPTDLKSDLELMVKKDIVKYANANFPDFTVVKSWNKETLIAKVMEHAVGN
jgi:hypothetical protein